MPVFVPVTLDTKGAEAAFVRDLLARQGLACCLVDTGCLGEPTVAADIPREAVFAAAGTTLAAVRATGDRGAAIKAAALGTATLILAHHQEGEVDAVLGLGGSAGTTIATAAMRALPLGLPKVMVSTLAAGQVRSFVEGKDIFMLNPVVDLAGLNRISRKILTQAVGAVAGLVRIRRDGPPPAPAGPDRPLVAATMFGVTTPCVEAARERLEAAGFEVLVFHATGSGGRTMEALIADGLIAGVLDVTTTELADELVGGILSAGPDRLTAAGGHGIPQAISVGALDMVNFGPRATVPAEFAGRTFVEHNAHVTLMRTTPAECRRLGEEIGRKAAAARGPVTIFLPLRGISALDADGKPFHDPAARAELFAGIRATAGAVPIVELDLHLNDPAFAAALADRLTADLAAGRPPH